MIFFRNTSLSNALSHVLGKGGGGVRSCISHPMASRPRGSACQCHCCDGWSQLLPSQMGQQKQCVPNGRARQQLQGHIAAPQAAVGAAHGCGNIHRRFCAGWTVRGDSSAVSHHNLVPEWHDGDKEGKKKNCLPAHRGNLLWESLNIQAPGSPAPQAICITSMPAQRSRGTQEFQQ